MKKKNLISALAITGLLFAYSCSGDSATEPTPDPAIKTTYDGNIKAIINGNCGSCHGATPTNGAPSSASFNTYAKVKAAVDNIIARTNDASNPMPTGGLMSTANRDLIKKWKTDGLLEN